MTIPDSEREHVFNVKKTALTDVTKGDQIFITSAASAVLGILTRIEVVKQNAGRFVETQTGRRFSIYTGRGLRELDRGCVACKLTPTLQKLFADLVAFRRSVGWIKTYDFSVLPVKVVEKITELVRLGEEENDRLDKWRDRRRRHEQSFLEALDDKECPMDHFEVKDQEEALKGYNLWPHVREIIVIRDKFLIRTTYGVHREWKKPYYSTMKSLLLRTRKGYFRHYTTTQKFTL